MLTGKNIEIAMDYPGQQLVVDPHTTTQADLDSAVNIVTDALNQHGVRPRSTMDIETERTLRTTT